MVGVGGSNPLGRTKLKKPAHRAGFLHSNLPHSIIFINPKKAPFGSY